MRCISFTPVFLLILMVHIVLENAFCQPVPPQSKIQSPPKNSHPSNHNHNFALVSYFNQNIQVNTDPDNQVDEFGPVIAVHEDTIYMVWNGDESNKSIFFSRSNDGGQTYLPATRINDTVVYPPGFSVYGPDIAVDQNGNIYVVWHDYRFWADDNSFTSPIEVFIDQSSDGGLTWGTDVQATSGSGTYPWHFQPYIDIDRSRSIIYISFTDYDRYTSGDLGDVSVVNSIDWGSSFSPKVRVDDTGQFSNAVQLFSNIAVNQVTGTVNIVFQDNRNGDRDIYLAQSKDTAQSFATNVKVNTVDTNDQEEPAIAIDPVHDIMYVAWKDWRADSMPDSADYYNHIYLARSTDGGLSFYPGVQVTDVFMNAEVGFNFPPDLAVDTTGRLYVVWHDSRMSFSNVFYDQSLDHGLSFGYDQLVNNNLDTLAHSLPRMAVFPSGASVIAWIDRRNPTTGGENKWDIFVGGSILENCEANQWLSGLLSSGNYQAGLTLSSDAVISSDAIVQFSAKESVILYPSFEALEGAQLVIFNEGCSP